MGIGLQDTEKHAAAVIRNWEFFRAPLASVVCMRRDLGAWDAMSVGMFLQTLLLALTERGLDSCVEVSIVGYPEIVRAELDIPEELSMLCGLAVGYADPDFAANKLKIGRESIGESAVFLDS
jgi:nitroreductase